MPTVAENDTVVSLVIHQLYWNGPLNKIKGFSFNNNISKSIALLDIGPGSMHCCNGGSSC